jgi:branched-chain amino acid transport system permease protein
MTKTTRFLGFAALMVIILGILPLILPSYYTGLLTLMFIYALFAMSLDILQGYTGLASLGHAAFFGTAAYVVGVLNVKVFHGPHLGVELVSGVLGAALTAAILGLIVLRSAGVYLLMILMASSMMLWGIAFKWRSLAGGDDGLPGIVRPDLAFLHMDLKQTTDFYYFILFFFVVGSALMYLVVRSSFGHTLLGIRESETRMKALGYNTWLQKYIAFIVSAAFAGLAGVLLAYYNGFVSPAELHLVNSAEVLIMVILGGVGTLFGPAIGAGIIILIKNIVSGYTEHWMIILGAVYMATVMLAPQGVYRLIERLLKGRSQEETLVKEEEKSNL